MPSSCTSSSLVILSEDRHHEHVAILSIDETFLTQQPFADQAALLVASHRARIIHQHGEPHAIEIHLVEGQSNHDPQRIAAQTLAPQGLLADRDKELSLAALPVDFSEAAISDQLGVERFDRKILRV